MSEVHPHGYMGNKRFLRGELLTTQRTFNSESFIEQNMTSFVDKIHPRGKNPHWPRIQVHPYHCRQHGMETSLEVENMTAESSESVLVALGNPHGFHVITILPLRAPFNVSWFIDGNLVPLAEYFFPARWAASRRKRGVHIGKAPAHNSRMIQNTFLHNPLKRLPHQSYSPDISPSDFYLFRKVKSALIGREIPDEINLPEDVTVILNGISDTELQCVFRSWIECVERVIDAGRDYLT
jgi:hypothetical protein